MGSRDINSGQEHLEGLRENAGQTLTKLFLESKRIERIAWGGPGCLR